MFKEKLDAFTWQIRERYLVMLKHTEQSSGALIDRLLDILIAETNLLQQERAFKEIEENTRSAVDNELREFLLKNIPAFPPEPDYGESEDKTSDSQNCSYDYPDDDSDEEKEESEHSITSEYDSLDDGDEDERSSVEESSESSNHTQSDFEEEPDVDWSNTDYVDREAVAWRRSEVERIHNLNLAEVIRECSGGKDLSWLVHQYAEYDFDPASILIKRLLEKKDIAIEYDLARHIIHLLFLARYYEAANIDMDGFVADALIGAFKDLKQNRLGELGENRTMKDALQERINRDYAKVKKLIDSGIYASLQSQYNAAYAVQDLGTMQRVWSVFSRFQTALRENIDVSTARAVKKEIDTALKRTEYYYRVVPELRHGLQLGYNVYRKPGEKKWKYRARKTEKSLRFDATPYMDELAKKGKELKLALIAQNPKASSTNVVTACMVFIVAVDGERHAIPVWFNPTKYQKPILSREQKDGVFVSDQEFTAYVGRYHNLGLQAQARAYPQKLKEQAIPNNASFKYHSERVFIKALEDQGNLTELTNQLHETIKQRFGEQKEPVKVYGAALLMSSTPNSVCEKCTPALTGVQSSYQQGVMRNLIDILNALDEHQQRRFVTRGKTARYSNKPIESRFQLTVIARSEKPFTPQALDMGKKMEDAANGHHNPHAPLHFKHSTIDLNRKGSNPNNNASIIEYSENPAKQLAAMPEGQGFVGKIFVSGSSVPQPVQRKFR